MNITTDKVQVEETTTGTSTSTTYKSSPPPTEYGWACPRCGRINAPWKSFCDCPGNNWYPTWYHWDYKEPWWKQVYCDSDTFKVHPETTTWKAPSSMCSSDSTTGQNPNSTIYTTAHNPVVGGSDYKVRDTYVNVVGTSSNDTNVTSGTTAWNNGLNTPTIHNGNINAKEEYKKETTPPRILNKYIKEKR